MTQAVDGQPRIAATRRWAAARARVAGLTSPFSALVNMPLWRWGGWHWRGWRWAGWHWAGLIGIVLLGAGLRVWRLDWPPIWGDEAATYGRVCGTYGEMAMATRQTAFGPLHYSLVWWVGQGMPIWPPGNLTWPQVDWKSEGAPPRIRSAVRWDQTPPLRIANYIPTLAERNEAERIARDKPGEPTPHERAVARAIFPQWTIALTPAGMRAIPTAAGIASILAMYYLARQVVRRKVALLVALFTACSVWMLIYSRDAKMYAELWFFAILSTAFLMHWTRMHRGWDGFLAGRRLLWWGWVAAGAAMVGVHALGFLILAVQVLIFMVAPRPHWGRGVTFLIGVLLILIGPANYYLQTSRMPQVANPEHFNELGIFWVEDRNKGKEGWELAADSASALVLGWNWVNEPFVRPWVDDPVLRVRPPVNAAVAPWVRRGMFAIGGLALLGLLPWRRMLRALRPSRRKLPASGSDHEAPWWRALLWIGLYLCIPMYGIYWASIGDALPPGEIADWILGMAGDRLASYLTLAGSGASAQLALAGRWALVIGGLAVIYGLVALAIWTSAPTWPRRLARLGALAGVVLGIALLCHLMVAGDERPIPKSVWMPRWAAIVWPALAIGLCTLLMRLPGWPLRMAAIVLLIGANLTHFVARITRDNEPPVNRIVADLIAYRPADPKSPGPTRVFSAMAFGSSGCPGGGMITNHVGNYYAAVMSATPMSPGSFRGGPHPLIRERPTSPDATIADLRRHSANFSTAIVWQVDEFEQDYQKKSAKPRDRYLEALGNNWEIGDEQRYQVRIPWSWANLYTLVRREYIRKPTTPATATRPATSPATRPGRAR